MDAAGRVAAERATEIEATRALQPPPPKLPGRDIPVVGPVLRGLDYIASNPISQAIAEYTVPDAPLLKSKGAETTFSDILNVHKDRDLSDLISGGNGRTMPGTNARQAFLDRSGQAPSTGAAKLAGQIAAPFFVPAAGLGTGAGLSRAADDALSAIPRLQGTGRLAAREGIVNGAILSGSEFAQGTGDPVQAAINGILGAGLGAGIGAGASVAGKAFANSKLGQAFNDFIGRKAPTPEEQLALPSPTLALPSPSVQPSTVARSATRANPYRQQLEQLFAEGQRLQQAGEMRPGYEREALEDLWGRMAGPDSPGLDELIDLATAPRPSRLKPDLVQQARDYQGSRQAAGVDLPVRSSSDRYPGGVLGQAAEPRQQYVTKAAEQVASEPAEQVGQNWFTRLFGESNLGITPFGSKKSNKIVTTEQQIVNNPLKSEVGDMLGRAKQTGRTTWQSTVDFLTPLKRISQQTYDAAMDASRANNMANTIIRDKFVDLEGNVIGKSLDEIMSNTRGLGKKVDDYLVLRHAITRMERGEKVYATELGMTPQKAREAVSKLESRYPELKQFGQDWNDFNANLLDSGVREGLISESSRDAMMSQNPNYASMRREFTLGEKMAGPKFGTTGSSFSGQNAPIKKVSPTGSTRKIVSPLRSAIEQTYAWKNAELRNRTMQEIVSKIQADPKSMEGIAEIVKKPSTSYKNLDQALREGGSEQFLELLDNDFRTLFKKTSAGEENIVRAMVKGQPVYVKVHDPEAVKALVGLGNDQAGLVLGAMQFLSNTTKRGATGMLAPMFALKSLGGDTVQAAIQSPNAIKHIAVDVPHAFISSMADALGIPGLGKLAEDFRRSGGEYSSLLRGDKQLNKSVSELRREPFLTPQGVTKGLKTTIKAPFRALEKVSDISENVNRMAAFRRALDGKERTPENVRDAINAARESTTNFSRRGSAAREFESVVPYTNAAIQGIYRVGNAFAKHPVKTTAAAGLLVVAPKLYEYAKFHDDPDYNKLPARERYRNLIISKNADGTFNKQFMPPEYEALGAFITDVLRHVVDDNPQAYKGTLDAVVNAFTPPAVSGALQGLTQGEGVEKSLVGLANSTVAAPFAATAFNQSFTGAPIVPKRLENNSPEFQYDERTSSIAKKIGQATGFAPLKVDYLIKAYGGDPSRLILPLFSDAGGGTPKNTLLKNFIVDPVFTNNLSDDYYKAKKDFETAKKDNKDFDKPLPSWYSEESYKLLNSQSNSSAAKQLSDLAQEKRQVTGDKTLTAQQKADQLRNLQQKINEIYTDVNSKIGASGYKFPNR
ncbi:LPD38 domain-containing protein [Paenibacillus filicis]